MSITVNCTCGGRFRVGDQHAGKKIKCPKCAGAVQVPEETDEGAAEPVAASKSTDRKTAKKGNTSKIAKAASSEAVVPEKGTDRKVGPVHRGDTVRLDTTKIEVLSQKSITSRKKRDESPAVAQTDDKKKVVILSVVVVFLLIGSIAVGYKVLQEPTGGTSTASENPPPTPNPPRQGPGPVNPTPPVNPPPVDPTPPGPEPSVPSEPESLDGLVWPAQDFGGPLPKRVHGTTTVEARGSTTEETSGRTRTYDVRYDWVDKKIVRVDGWFDDRAGNKLTFKDLVFCTAKDQALIDAVTAKGGYLREGAAKSGTIVIAHANERGSLTITFREGRVTEAVGMAPTYTGEFQDVDKLRKEHQAVSTLLGLLTEVATEVRDFGQFSAEK
ncbi:MAG: hypothetical protein AAB434_08685 [Planctomycetota bacterium]